MPRMALLSQSMQSRVLIQINHDTRANRKATGFDLLWPCARKMLSSQMTSIK